MKILKSLELHVSNTCNFKCDGCDHYSNYNHKGIITIEQAEEWISKWSGRINPDSFRLIGGEPTIHPKLSLFIPLVRKYFPLTPIWLITNGSYLHNHPDLPKVIAEDNNTILHLSLHHTSKEYFNFIKPIKQLLTTWVNKYKIKVIYWHSYMHWNMRYNGYGKQMEPFTDNNSKASWEACPGKGCFQLLNGDIYKCPQIAYLNMQNEKFKLSDSWKPYLSYVPLKKNCSEEELNIFFDKKEEDICNMCPSKFIKLALTNPLP